MFEFVLPWTNTSFVCLCAVSTPACGLWVTQPSPRCLRVGGSTAAWAPSSSEAPRVTTPAWPTLSRRPPLDLPCTVAARRRRTPRLSTTAGCLRPGLLLHPRPFDGRVSGSWDGHLRCGTSDPTGGSRIQTIHWLKPLFFINFLSWMFQLQDVWVMRSIEPLKNTLMCLY